MNKLHVYPVSALFFLAVALLTGCSTTVRGSKKLDAYDQKISSPTIMWQSNATLNGEIRKTAGLASLAKISDSNIADAKENLGKLLQMLSSQSIGVVSARLKVDGVVATALANDAPTSPKGAKHLIKIYPDFAGSECSAMHCSHDVGLIVTVWDFELKKTVWQGDFKVGAPMGGPVTQKLLDSFADNLVSELRKAQLI